MRCKLYTVDHADRTNVTCSAPLGTGMTDVLFMVYNTTCCGNDNTTESRRDRSTMTAVSCISYCKIVVLATQQLPDRTRLTCFVPSVSRHPMTAAGPSTPQICAVQSTKVQSCHTMDAEERERSQRNITERDGKLPAGMHT